MTTMMMEGTPVSTPTTAFVLPAMGERGNDFFWKMSDIFKACSSDVRLMLLEELRNQNGHLSVNALVNRLKDRGYDLKQPTISHHLRILRHGGLINCIPDGLFSYYYLCRENFDLAQEMLALYMRAPEVEQ